MCASPEGGREGDLMLTLNRILTNERGCYGTFILDRRIICYSLELPWLGNIPTKSCIPVGTYPLTKINHARYQSCFQVDNVPLRSGILIHPGNTLSDTKGCILPGLDVDPLGVKSSRPALIRLLQSLPTHSTLIIRESK